MTEPVHPAVEALARAQYGRNPCDDRNGNVQPWEALEPWYRDECIKSAMADYRHVLADLRQPSGVMLGAVLPGDPVQAGRSIRAMIVARARELGIEL